MQIKIPEDLNIVTGNYHFPPGTHFDILQRHFNYLGEVCVPRLSERSWLVTSIDCCWRCCDRCWQLVCWSGYSDLTASGRYMADVFSTEQDGNKATWRFWRQAVWAGAETCRSRESNPSLAARTTESRWRAEAEPLQREREGGGEKPGLEPSPRSWGPRRVYGSADQVSDIQMLKMTGGVGGLGQGEASRYVNWVCGPPRRSWKEGDCCYTLLHSGYRG
jgi:hypothetical protein